MHYQWVLIVNIVSDTALKLVSSIRDAGQITTLETLLSSLDFDSKLSLMLKLIETCT